MIARIVVLMSIVKGVEMVCVEGGDVVSLFEIDRRKDFRIDFSDRTIGGIFNWCEEWEVRTFGDGNMYVRSRW